MRVLHSLWRPGLAQAAAVLLAVVAAPLAAVSATAPHAAAATAACPWVDSTAPISQRVSALMSKMTLSQEISLMTGVGEIGRAHV